MLCPLTITFINYKMKYREEEHVNEDQVEELAEVKAIK